MTGALSRGEQPRVAVSTAHNDVPAGSRGVVTGHDGTADEPFTVRVTLDGADRDVTFPATALSLVPRTRAEIIARTAATPGADTADGSTDPDREAGAQQSGAGASGDAAAGGGAPAESGTPDAAAAGDAPAKPGSSDAPAKPGSSDAAADPAAGGSNGEAPARKTKPAKSAGRKATRSAGGDVVITVTVAGDGASVEATHGTRKLVKGATLPVGAGHALAQLVNIESVTAAVEAVIAEHRTAKEAEADQLRNRLAELEKQLAEYQDIDVPDPA